MLGTGDKMKFTTYLLRTVTMLIRFHEQDTSCVTLHAGMLGEWQLLWTQERPYQEQRLHGYPHQSKKE